MTLGERIVEIRKERGITQKRLAEMLNITPTRLNYWEKDKRFPPIPMLNKLSEVLDVDGDYLIGRQSERKISASQSNTEAVEGHKLEIVKDYSGAFNDSQRLLAFGGGGQTIPSETIDAIVSGKDAYEERLREIKLKIMNSLRENRFTEEELLVIQAMVNTIGRKGGDA